MLAENCQLWTPYTAVPIPTLGSLATERFEMGGVIPGPQIVTVLLLARSLVVKSDVAYLESWPCILAVCPYAS